MTGAATAAGGSRARLRRAKRPAVALVASLVALGGLGVGAGAALGALGEQSSPAAHGFGHHHDRPFPPPHGLDGPP